MNKKTRLDFIRQMLEKNQTFDNIREELQSRGVKITEKRLLKEITEVVDDYGFKYLDDEREILKMIAQYDDLFEENRKLMQTTEARIVLEKKKQLLDDLRTVRMMK